MKEYKDYLREWADQQGKLNAVVAKIMTVCEVTHTTAYRWLAGKCNPQKGQRKLLKKALKLDF